MIGFNKSSTIALYKGTTFPCILRGSLRHRPQFKISIHEARCNLRESPRDVLNKQVLRWPSVSQYAPRYLNPSETELMLRPANQPSS